MTYQRLICALKRKYISRIKNSSTGQDEIPSGVIKKAWLVLKKYIKSFFGMCLHNGHHSRCFKSAILCTLSKPGKKIRLEPRLYHLIALLLYFGKVLERVVQDSSALLLLKQSFSVIYILGQFLVDLR